MSVRAEIDEILANAPEGMFIPASAWEGVMEANKSYMHLRPDPSVRVDNTASAALFSEATRASSVLLEYDLLINPDEHPSNIVPHTIPLIYIEFETLMRNMVNMMVRVLSMLDSVEESQGFEPLVLLALPNLRFDKSNAWFLLSLWHQIASLRQRTSGVVGNGETAKRLLRALSKRHTSRRFALYVLYVDDMAYSGGQVLSFFGHPFDADNHEHFLPIIPFVGARVVNQNAQQLGIRYNLTWPQVIHTPAHRIEQKTNRHYIRDIVGRTLFGQRYHDTETLSDKPGSSRIAFDELLMKMKGLLRVNDETRSLYHENRNVFQAACTFYRLSEIFKPAIIFEHKVADNVSISTRLITFPTIDDAPFPVNTAPSLVNMSGPLEKGSRSFYKGLVWKQAPANARFKCLLCPKPASFRCSQCKVVSYCGTVCQASHWDSLHAMICC
jgi:hypothetical protein